MILKLPSEANYHLYVKKLNFPGGPVVKTLHFQCRGTGSIPGPGTKILQAMQQGQKKKGKKKLTFWKLK